MPNPHSSPPFGLPSLRPPSPLPHELTPSQISHQISTASRSILNRLRSIHHDSQFLLSIHSAYHGRLPLVVNKRAGEWYVPPPLRAGSVYFKSTDGHTGNWGFSLRRLNLHLLEIIEKGGGEGAIIVDSTRRGKRYPDSLSKTIPIWCALINTVLFPTHTNKLYTPPHVISPQENHYIRALLPTFLTSFSSLNLNLSSLPHLPKKPLRPFFINPDDLFTPPPINSNDKSQHLIFEDYIPLVLASASRVVKNDGVEGEYIQGAGDDAENWLKNINLDPQFFWTHHQQILNCQTDGEVTGLTKVLRPLVEETQYTLGLDATNTYSVTLDDTLFILPKPFVGEKYPLRQGEHNIIIDVSAAVNYLATAGAGAACDRVRSHCGIMGSTQSIFHLPLPQKGKPAKFLREKILPSLLEFLARESRREGSIQSILVISDNPGDVSVAIALFVLSLWYNDSGALEIPPSLLPSGIDKIYIRRRLTWIISAMGEAVSVSRANLNSVNAILMQRFD
ncbi:tRNA A64-2'-O-ribosylphosphate transferase [Tirmania nivea]|nr:tRNA A64-2'-O-ribosylphosphate transferase [Tirmania nivea]